MKNETIIIRILKVYYYITNKNINMMSNSGKESLSVRHTHALSTSSHPPEVPSLLCVKNKYTSRTPLINLTGKEVFIESALVTSWYFRRL